jgi:hypothetical protein
MFRVLIGTQDTNWYRPIEYPLNDACLALAGCLGAHYPNAMRSVASIAVDNKQQWRTAAVDDGGGSDGRQERREASAGSGGGGRQQHTTEQRGRRRQRG